MDKRCQSSSLNMKKILLILVWLLLPLQAWAVYNLPSSRVITWTNTAGLDPVGGIPTTWTNCTTSQCNTLYGGTVTATSINNAITSAPSNSIVRIPAGNYTITGNINMKSNVILRGAKSPSTPWLPTADASATTLNMSGSVYFNGGDQEVSWYPGANQGTSITSGYTKDSTSITLSSTSNYDIGDWISVYQDSDASLPIDFRGNDYLGEDNCSGDCHVKQQYVKITGKNGNVLTINPGIYYVSPNPTGQAVRKLAFGMTMAGIENIRLNGGGNQSNAVYFRNVFYCWAKGIETYNFQGANGTGHILTGFSHGVEIRDSYIHYGGTYSSGRSYGIDFYHWNSGHKIENNIVTNTRHSIIFEGGGSGCAILYNYSTDNYESEDSNYLSQSMTQNHGAHPHMNLWEGNIDQQFYGDWTQGSSSHNTLFRNWVLGYRASPSATDNIVAIRVGPYNRYYNLVGNVAGRSAWTSGQAICNLGSCGNNPHAFEFGIHTNGSYMDSGAYSTSINHGNYDYVTDGVALWQGGSDHVLANSMYYSSKPSWFGGCTWPPIDPVGPVTADIPAKLRYNGSSCPSSDPAPSAPQNLGVIQ